MFAASTGACYVARLLLPYAYVLAHTNTCLQVTLNMYNKWGKTYYEPYCGSGASL